MKMSSNKKYDFSGKIVLVTGSSSGIGAASAIQFAKYGAQLTIHGRDAEALDKVAKQIQHFSGNEPLQVVGDLLEDSNVDMLINETIKKFGRLDVLVNNAGMGTAKGSFHDAEMIHEFDKIMMVNVRAALKLIHLAGPHLEKTKGNIVNVSSIASIRCFSPVYSISKAALDMITKSAAQEFGPKGIRVNSVNPGPVKTQFGRSFGMPDVMTIHEEMIKQRTALNRIAESEDIANVISFLASSDAVNITGDILISDSGSLVFKPKQSHSREGQDKCKRECEGHKCEKK